MTLPEPNIRIIQTGAELLQMLSDLEEEQILAVDTETVGHSTLPLFESIPPLRKAWWTSAREFCARFPKSEGGMSMKGAKTAKGAVDKIAKDIDRVYKAISNDKSGLHFWECYLGCFQVGLEDGTVYMIKPQGIEPSEWIALGKFLNSRKTLLLANAIFDIKMIYQHTGILLDGRRIFDVQVAEWALQNGREEDDEASSKGKKKVNPYKLAQAKEDKAVVKKSVKHLTKKYLKLELSKDVRVRISNWLAPWTDDQLKYAALDVLVLFGIYRKQKTRIFMWKLDEAIKLRNTFTTVAAILDMSGLPLDIAGLRSYKTELEKRLAYQDMDLRIQLEVDDEFNLNSTEQLHAVLTRHGLILENTNEKTMKLKYANDARVNAILDYRGTQKLLQVVTKYLDYSRDGRIYSQFRIDATATGRLASGSDEDKDPWYVNAQNPPKGQFREYITAPKGCKFINADYSQIELRWNAQLANDPVMIEAYRNGKDLHQITAQETAGLTDVQWASLSDEKKAAWRQKAKAQNFGLLFGAGWSTLKNYAQINYNVHMSDEEAMEARDAWKRKYEVTAAYQRWHPYKVKEAGMVRTASGFLRWFPVEAYTDSLNTPVQGSAADGFLNGMNLLFYGLVDDGYEPLRDFRLPNKVHDEVIAECPEHFAEEMLERVNTCLTKGMAKYLTLVPVVVEGKIVEKWSEKG